MQNFISKTLLHINTNSHYIHEQKISENGEIDEVEIRICALCTIMELKCCWRQLNEYQSRKFWAISYIFLSFQFNPSGRNREKYSVRIFSKFEEGRKREIFLFTAQRLCLIDYTTIIVNWFWRKCSIYIKHSFARAAFLIQLKNITYDSNRSHLNDT